MIRPLLAACLFGLVATSQSPQQAPAAEPVVVEVRGVVLDELGAPAAGVAVAHAVGATPDARAALKSPLAETAADGSFSVSVTLSPDEADALLFGGRRFATRRCTLSASKRDLDLGAFSMAPGFAATGRVRAADGDLPADVVVIGTDMLDSRTYLSQSRYRQTTKCWTCASVPTRGIFVLTGMVRSAGTIEFRCPGYYDEQIEPVAMGTPLDVTLHPAPTARGRVVDTNGEPVVEANVSVGSARTKTGEDGSWELQLRDRGVTAVRAWSRRGGVYASVNEQLPDDGAALSLTLDVPAALAKGALRVRARAADGAPVEAFTACVSWNQANQLRYRPDAQLVHEAMERENRHGDAKDGEVTVEGPSYEHEDTGIVFVRAEGYAWGRVEVGRDALGKDPIVVDLGTACAIGGRVVDTDTGEPIAGAQVVVTPKLEDNIKGFFEQGFYDVSNLVGPFSVETDGDGRWRAGQLAAGEVDVFVLIGGKSVRPAERHEVTGAADEKLQDLEFKVHGLTSLRGTIEGARLHGLQIRPHWHRPNMSSSSWATEYDGAVPLAADGTFVMSDLAPVAWRPEVLLPAPPRGGLRHKLECEVWDGADPKADYKASIPEVLEVTGSVAGEIPWHRLGVLAPKIKENEFAMSFTPQCAITPLEPDRTFRMRLPSGKWRLLLVDMFTGVAVAWLDLDADALARPVTFPGEAVEVSLQIGADPADVVRSAKMTYEPDDEHWPLPTHPAFRNQPRSGMEATVLSGRELTIWLPNRGGTLKFQVGETTASFECERLTGGRLDVTLGADSIDLKKP